MPNPNPSATVVTPPTVKYSVVCGAIFCQSSQHRTASTCTTIHILCAITLPVPTPSGNTILARASFNKHYLIHGTPRHFVVNTHPPRRTRPPAQKQVVVVPLTQLPAHRKQKRVQAFRRKVAMQSVSACLQLHPNQNQSRSRSRNPSRPKY